MNELFAELYQAYRVQIQAALRANEKTPNMLFTFRYEHFRVLLDQPEAAHYFNMLQDPRAIFGVPFIETDDQTSTWNLWVLADQQK